MRISIRIAFGILTTFLCLGGLQAYQVTKHAGKRDPKLVERNLLVEQAKPVTDDAFRNSGRKVTVKHIHLASSAKHPVMTGPRTTFSAGAGKIELDVDLGSPVITAAKDSVLLAPASFRFSKLGWSNITHGQLPNGLTLLESHREGSASYPVLTITFAIPEDASSISPFVSNSKLKDIGQVYLLPAAERYNDSLFQRVYKASRYNSNWPTKPILGAPQVFRTLRSVTLRVPLAIRTNSGKMSVLSTFTAGIDFHLQQASNTQVIRDPYFTAANNRLVVNSGDLSRFAVPFHTASHAGRALRVNGAVANGDTVTSWIDPNAEYIKLFVTRDGLYRVTSDEISTQAGFSLKDGHWDAASLRMINRGKEVPIWVDTNATGDATAIEFYGVHLPGYRGEYYNMSTDSNVYWLTSAHGSTRPMRYISKQYPTSQTDSLITSGDVLLHHERDYFYYDGDKGVEEATKQRTEIVAGERFYWKPLLSPNGPGGATDTSRLIDTFHVAAMPQVTNGKTAKFHFFVRGMSSPGDTAATHRVVVRLNGANIADRSFRDYDSITLDLQVPLTNILPTNIIEVLSAGTTVSIDEFYVDFYEVSLEEGLAPSMDTAIAPGQWQFSVTTNIPRIDLSLNSGARAHLYNLTSGSRLISQTSIFADSLISVSANYVAATDASLLRCDRISIWGSSNNKTSWRILHPSTGADYIVLTHPNFIDAANRLAARRQSAGMRTLVVTTDEVFSAFDYGSNEPEAIRRFLRYAYNSYPGVPVGFVTLVGDAAWDPKANLNNTLQSQGERTNQLSYVPTQGQPVSDFYFTLVNGDFVDTIQPSMLIARIPVSTPSEADAFLTKLVEYENAPPAEWNKNFLFLVGGDQGGQHDGFMSEIHDYVFPGQFPNYRPISLPPMNIQGTIIGRTDFFNLDATHVSEIQTLLRQGQAITYFTGHGATFTSDILMPDPTQLRNKALYTTLITLSCRTGAFAENNMVTLNEAYLRASEGGAIMCFGTTGYGNTAFDDVMTRKLFTLMEEYPRSSDTTHAQSMNMTQLFTAAKLFAADSGGGFGFTALNSRLQYTILGDAAMGFCLKPQPEFSVNASEVLVHGQSPTPTTLLNVSDSLLSVAALIHNNGYSAERPVIVRMRDVAPGGLTFDKLDTLQSLDDTVTVYASFPLNNSSEGEHTISVFVDPANQFAEINEADNESSVHIFVNGLSASPLYPYDASKGFCDVNESHVRLIVLVPSAPVGSSSGHLQIQIDTTNRFISPYLIDSVIGAQPYLESNFALNSLPYHASVYWWRSRIVNGLTSTPWRNASFNVTSIPQSELNLSTSDQLSSIVQSGLSVSANGRLFLPQTDTLQYRIISHGINDTGVASHPVGLIEINDKVVYQLSPPFGRYALAIFRPDESAIDTVYEFDLPDSNQYDSAFNVKLRAEFDRIVKSIPTGIRVAFLSNIQPVFEYFVYNDTIKNDMMMLGSKAGFEGLSYFGSYALIGRKGSSPGSAREQFKGNGQGPAEVTDTSITFGTYGVARTPATTVATRYHTFSWTGPSIPAGSEINFTITGTKRDGSGNQTIATLQASKGNSIDLSGIDTRQFNRLSVLAEFVRTANATASPEISSLSLGYDAAPELVFTLDSISTAPNPVREGDSVAAQYIVHALTCTDADNIAVSLTRTSRGNTDTVYTHLITHLVGHSNAFFRDLISTHGEQGKIDLVAQINPGGAVNEQLLFNNVITGSYTVARDTSKPFSEILLNDRHIPDRGYVGSKSTITVNLYSQGIIRQLDTNSIVVHIFNEKPPIDPVDVTAKYHPGYSVQTVTLASGPVQQELILTPEVPFAAGVYDIAVYAHDASGNIADTITQRFTVADQNGIDHVMNYPNPFKDKTDFTFELRTDPQPGTDVRIVIYTVSGRKIKTMTPLQLHAGLNIMAWDGRDEDGNDVANGTYLYRVVLNGSNSDGSGVSDGLTEKAVRSR